MRHLLTTILLVVLASFIFTTCHNNIEAFLNPTDTAAEIDEEKTVEARYYGDTLYQYDGIYCI